MARKVERLVIISPRAVSPAGTMPRIHPPLGAISVLAEAKRAGYDAILLDAAAEGLKRSSLDSGYSAVTTEELDGVAYWKTGISIDEILARIHELNPDVIGISCCTVVDRSETAKIAKAIKASFPDTPLILGGHEATHWYQEILGQPSPGAIPEIDYVVVGPGQPVIGQLLSFLKDNSDPPKGVATRENGAVVYSGPSTFIPDQHAIPDYSLLPRIEIPGREKSLDLYSSFGNPHAGKIGVFLGKKEPLSYLPLLTSYGCGFSCSFCDTDKKLVRYSVDNVMRIVEQFETIFGLDYIDFMDNNFGGGNPASRKVAFEVLGQISKTGYDIGFSNGLTFESMARDDFSLIRSFKQGGNVRHIAFPCENGNDRILRMVRKPHTLTLVRDVLDFARANLPETNREGFFIGGFPETFGQPAEKPKELNNTLAFITECLEQQRLNQAIFLTLSPVTREYRLIWRRHFPNAPFEHCLFSRRTGIWPYPYALLDDMHAKVKSINQKLGRSVTRNL